jgi:hypothetical protein
MIPNVNPTITKGDDGIYTVSSPAAPVEAFFTVADGYAYITAMRKESIAPGTRMSAAKLLPADDRTLVGVTLRIDQIDDNLKQIALLQLENQMAAEKERKAPNETSAQSKLKAEMIDHVSRQIKSLLKDGRALDVQWTVDRKADDLAVQLSLTAKPGTPLAQDIASQSSKASRFGWLAGAAGQAALNLAVPAELRAGLSAVMDEGFKQSQAREKDPIKNAHAQKVYDTLGPTLKAGQLDVMGGIAGPDAGGKFTLFGGVKVTDSPSVERLVRELIPQIPDPRAKDAIKLDAETVAGVKAHKVMPYNLDDDAKRVFGPGATALIAFPPDAVVVAFGADAGGMLKQLLAAKGRVGGPFTGEAAVGRLALVGKNSADVSKKVAAEVFGQDLQADLVRFTVEGGAALQLRAAAKGKLFRFGVKLDEASKASSSPP